MAIIHEIPVYDATHHALFVTDAAMTPHDPREQSVAQAAPESPEKRVWRAARARVLESVLKEDEIGFYKMLAQYVQDDPGIVEELRGRAYAKAYFATRGIRRER